MYTLHLLIRVEYIKESANLPQMDLDLELCPFLLEEYQLLDSYFPRL